MSRRVRRRQPPPDLTSLFDVLFIVIFAALIRAAAVQKAAAQPATPPPKPPAPPVKLEVAQLQARAVAALDKDLPARPSVIVRISATGSITSLETGGKLTPLDTPLLEHSPDPDIALAYLGDRSSEQRVCRVAAVHLSLPDLARYLVILAPEKSLADLPHALVEGLRRDVEHCLFEQKGLAVIVDPSIDPTVTTPAPSPPSPMVKP
ncbi:MAG TPA: hypothetical protein VLB44_11630 [Kofleriaceae bacterium]|nr:hypothetical protein [Kofleriaceae bacterium]